MAYFRKRYNRRRYYKKPLSNYNIATRTSAKSQSKQIFYLKKRVNRIQRLTKPEIVTIQRNSSKINLVSGQGVANWVSSTDTTSAFIAPNLGPLNSNVIGETNSPVPNNFARLHNLKVYGNMQYTGVSSSSVPVNLRIVIVQLRTSRASGLTSADIFTSGSSGNDNFSAVFGPLQTGLARTCKVLSDKRYCLSFQRPSINIRTSLKYLKNFYRDNNSSSSSVSSESFAKGSIYVFYAIYTSSNVEVGALDLIHKLAYTDA